MNDKRREIIWSSSKLEVVPLGLRLTRSFGRRQGLRTPAQVRAYLRALDQTMQRTAEDTQLANVDLQNILQKQQQTLQMMSNISKMLHDTAMSVIRKIGG